MRSPRPRDQPPHGHHLITNSPGARVLPGAAYDAYTDPLSKHRYLANLLRLYLQVRAYKLLVRLRHLAANPPEDFSRSDIPTEPATGRLRNQLHNRRHESG